MESVVPADTEVSPAPVTVMATVLELEMAALLASSLELETAALLASSLEYRTLEEASSELGSSADAGNANNGRHIKAIRKRLFILYLTSSFSHTTCPKLLKNEEETATWEELSVVHHINCEIFYI
jgi:hypothetical protein